jgi:molybdopterin biosynthesis enzyme MoaB
MWKYFVYSSNPYERGDYMMHGEINEDRLCRVIEQILSERDSNIEVKVRIIPKEDAEEIHKSTETDIKKKEDDVVNNGSV